MNFAANFDFCPQQRRFRIEMSQDRHSDLLATSQSEKKILSRHLFIWFGLSLSPQIVLSFWHGNNDRSSKTASITHVVSHKYRNKKKSKEKKSKKMKKKRKSPKLLLKRHSHGSENPVKSIDYRFPFFARIPVLCSKYRKFSAGMTKRAGMALMPSIRAICKDIDSRLCGNDT